MADSDLEPGCVWLVGTANGPLPAAALRALRQADFVLFDAGIDPDLLRFVPAGAVAEKAAGDAARRAIDLAMVGWRVVRLTAGDPLASPEGAAEAALLSRAGVGLRILSGDEPLPATAAHALAMAAETDRRSPRHHPAAFTMSGMG